jgi:tetratricopeptide (TPR) repeat protein
VSTQQILLKDFVGAASALMNLGSALFILGDASKADQCMKQAEELDLQTGSTYQQALSKYTRANMLTQAGCLDKAEVLYREALGLLREQSIHIYEISLLCDLSQLYFSMGKVSAAMDTISRALTLIHEKGHDMFEDKCLCVMGKLLIRSGSLHEGFKVLEQARKLSASYQHKPIYCAAILFLALGYEELGNRQKALALFNEYLKTAESQVPIMELLEERDVLINLLLKLGNDLPQNEFLAKLITQLRNPTLAKRLVRLSPDTKSSFIRSLTVQDLNHYRPLIGRLINDRHNNVRRNSRLAVSGWQKHTKYRIYTLGTFRAFCEGKALTEEGWVRPSAKKFFLFFLTHPNEWHTIDSIVEILWQGHIVKNPRKVVSVTFSHLRNLFEPWVRLKEKDREYRFFQSGRNQYGFFTHESFWIDAVEFEKGLKQAEKAIRLGNIKEARKDYRDALDLYLDNYLTEFPYEDWLQQRRTFLQELYFRSLFRYATMERDTGNLPEARIVLEQGLFRDLSRSDCVILLMEILVSMNHTQQAREWGERHAQYLKKELKIKPWVDFLEAFSKTK